MAKAGTTTPGAARWDPPRLVGRLGSQALTLRVGWGAQACMLGLICAGLEGVPDAQQARAKAAILPLLAFFLFEHDLLVLVHVLDALVRFSAGGIDAIRAVAAAKPPAGLVNQRQRDTLEIAAADAADEADSVARGFTKKKKPKKKDGDQAANALAALV